MEARFSERARLIRAILHPEREGGPDGAGGGETAGSQPDGGETKVSEPPRGNGSGKREDTR
jgi:hypothetical protein